MQGRCSHRANCSTAPQAAIKRGLCILPASFTFGALNLQIQMNDQKASRTALGTAHLRAAHQLLDAAPRILEDSIAVRLLGEGAGQKICESAEHYRNPAAAGLRSHVVLRSRFAEDRLAAAVPKGVKQYVILGAGFDTFAFRQPDWAKSLKIFEIDHPRHPVG
jgi:O-methyltransferase involved in polyketide biosynthesis